MENSQAEYDRAIAAFNEQEKALEQSRLDKIEMLKNEAVKRAGDEEERQGLERVAKENRESAKRLQQEKVDSLARMKRESEEYWKKETEDAVSFGVSERLNTLRANERAEMEKIIGKERKELEILKKIEDGFKKSLDADYVDHLETIVDIAYRFRTADELDKIVDIRQKNFSKEIKKRKKLRGITKRSQMASKKKK